MGDKNPKKQPKKKKAKEAPKAAPVTQAAQTPAPAKKK
jgi:hypothetical protein